MKSNIYHTTTIQEPYSMAAAIEYLVGQFEIPMSQGEVLSPVPTFRYVSGSGRRYFMKKGTDMSFNPHMVYIGICSPLPQHSECFEVLVFKSAAQILTQLTPALQTATWVCDCRAVRRHFTHFQSPDGDAVTAQLFGVLDETLLVVDFLLKGHKINLEFHARQYASEFAKLNLPNRE